MGKLDGTKFITNNTDMLWSIPIVPSDVSVAVRPLMRAQRAAAILTHFGGFSRISLLPGMPQEEFLSHLTACQISTEGYEKEVNMTKDALADEPAKADAKAKKSKFNTPSS